MEVASTHEKKVDNLCEKWDRTVPTPDVLRDVEVDVRIDEFPEEFSSQPRLYGGVALDEDEKLALELPTKFGLYRKLDMTQCKIDIEESLNKLRWNRILAGNKNSGVVWMGTQERARGMGGITQRMEGGRLRVRVMVQVAWGLLTAIWR